MKINWKIRVKNPVWWAQVVLAVLTPILAYMGLTLESLTSWCVLGNVLLEAVKNPYVLGLVVISLWNACTDPTTKGLRDSERALNYQEPQ